MILLEHGPQGQPCLFRAPLQVIAAHRLAGVAPALAEAEAARRAGHWIAGYLTYEAGLAFEPRLAALQPPDQPGPLLVLGVFDAPESAEATLEAMHVAGLRSQISPPQPGISRASYETAIGRLLDYIAAGDCYQVNLTFPMQAQLLAGGAFGLYGALRRTGPVGHGAYVDLGQGPVIVSRSPELFFRLHADGLIEARPMKGTRPRDPDPARDAALAAELAGNAKDRAENLMIVDLLRNDISRITRPGSVKVPELFAIEHYSTVHQMVSSIRGQLSAAADLPGLMRALFPCGSITGAPKIRAMEIIAELEPAARGVYCGAIGWMAPEGQSDLLADFSVSIRTLSIMGDRITLNVGGGVVQDSTPQGEWEEALWKARFVKAAETPPCG